MPAICSQAVAVPSDVTVLTKAALRAAEQLGMTNKTLAAVIGVSEATISRMRSGNYTLQRGQKSFELAILFVRFYRALDTIVGGDEAVARAWLRNPNTRFDSDPLTLIQTVPGLMNAIHYLDARRAIV
jgi:DNA-binding XRE family transcriptional regulator